MPSRTPNKTSTNTMTVGSLWLMVAVVALSSAAALAYRWPAQPSAQVPTMRQALYDFDDNDLPTAAAAFRALADRGDARAEFWYGHALEHGLGLPADPKLALAEYRKAWAGGDAAAGRRLGELDMDGNLGAPDFAHGRALLTEAAGKGDARAALDLGDALRSGIGGPVDRVGAYAWLEIASLGGNAEARVERNQLLPSLSQDQQAAASQQVKAWQDAHAKPVATTTAAAPSNTASSKE